MRITIDVTDCRDCPCRKNQGALGMNWEYCTHKKAPKNYKSILWSNGSEKFEAIPSWCPGIG